ncbi:MAG: single-stranded DNA-binding protein [Sulfurovum sp.]|nr:single-stranded DNA-binding protein [Sulfurovum sp.]
MYNKVIIAGHLSKDIELRYTQSGSAIANTAIATSRKFKGSDGSQREEVLFVDVSFFGRTAEIVNQYLHKGSKVLIDGRLKLEQWTAQDGTKRSKHKIDAESVQMLDGKESGDSSKNPNSSHTAQQPVPATTPQPHHQPSPPLPNMGQSEEIPF